MLWTIRSTPRLEQGKASLSNPTTRMAHGKEGPTSWEGKHESNGYPTRLGGLFHHAGDSRLVCCTSPTKVAQRPQQKAPSSFQPLRPYLVLQMRHLLLEYSILSRFVFRARQRSARDPVVVRTPPSLPPSLARRPAPRRAAAYFLPVPRVGGTPNNSAPSALPPSRLILGKGEHLHNSKHNHSFVVCYGPHAAAITLLLHKHLSTITNLLPSSAWSRAPALCMGHENATLRQLPTAYSKHRDYYCAADNHTVVTVI